jgi:acetylornithine deacetylase/succinyl-diaminopimelate desuccinylase-like protein
VLTENQWRDLTDWIDRHQERSLDRLMELLRLPTMAHIDRPNPALQQCAGMLVQMLTEIGVADAEIAGTDFHPLVLGTLGDDPGKPTLLVYGHFDVEDPGPLTEWQSPPFEPAIRNGRIYARGSADNKGQFLCHLLAVAAYQQAGIEVPVNLKFVLDGAEEIGSPSLDILRQTRPEAMWADIVFCADGPAHESGRPKIVLGSRGAVYLEARLRTLRRSSHSQYAAILPSAAWRAVELLASIRDTTGRIAIAGFYENVVPPTAAELDLLRQIPPVERELTREFAPKPPFPARSAEEFNYQLLMEPFFNITGIASGDLVSYTTVVPGDAVIKVEIGIVPEQTPDEIIDKTRAHLREFGIDPADTTVIFVADPTRTPPDHPLVRPMAEAVARGWGAAPVVVNRFGGYSSHHAQWSKLGIPAISSSYGPPDQSNHAPNENYTLENFSRGIATTAAILDAVGATEYRGKRPPA